MKRCWGGLIPLTRRSKPVFVVRVVSCLLALAVDKSVSVILTATMPPLEDGPVTLSASYTDASANITFVWAFDKSAAERVLVRPACVPSDAMVSFVCNNSQQHLYDPGDYMAEVEVLRHGKMVSSAVLPIHIDGWFSCGWGKKPSVHERGASEYWP